MGHYSVLVFGDDIDEQMSPFYVECDDDDIVEFEENTIDVVDSWLGREKKDASIELGTWADDWGYIKTEDELSVLEMTNAATKITDKITDPGKLTDALHAAGIQFGQFYNPNAFWDWFLTGGRWKWFFLLKENCFGTSEERPSTSNVCDSAKIGDIDWDGMIAKHERVARKQYREAMKDNCDQMEWKYGIRMISNDSDGSYRKPTLEEHLERAVEFNVYGTLSDGVYETVDNQSNLMDLINSFDLNTRVTMLDCHM